MTDVIVNETARRPTRLWRWSASLLLGFVIFALLWLLHIPLRPFYVPSEDDISNLADSLLLAPGVHWYNWFTLGDTHFFDLYPDWPEPDAELAWVGYSRPVFQFIIYLSHFVLGNDWASYQLINCFAIACIGGAAFQIAQAVLGLSIRLSFVSAILVVLSPPLLVSLLFGVGYAIDPLATVLVAGAFLAILARRDLLGLALLFLAVLTKENALWAPFAAAMTIALRPTLGESLRRRTFSGAVMLLPFATWLALRFAFFHGIEGTYATAGYAPFVSFLKLILLKLTHLHYLFVNHTAPLAELRGRSTVQTLVDRATAVLIYALLSLWVLRIMSEFHNIRNALRDKRWPVADAFFLVTLWASIALAFYFVLPLDEDRYASSVVVFAWPALVAEVARRGKTVVWLGLAALSAVSLTRTSYFLFETIAQPLRNDYYRSMDAYRVMDAAIAQAPTGTREIYVVSAGGLQVANPEYVAPILGTSAKIVRIAEIVWKCADTNDLVAFDHNIIDGVVSMTASLPTCAAFAFFTDRFNNSITNGRLRRDDTVSYQLSEANPKVRRSSLCLGRKIIVQVRPHGPARFIIEHGAPNGIAWFDTP